MRKLVNLFKNKTILAVDPATHSIAFSVINYNDGNIILAGYGKISLRGCKTNDERFARIGASIPLLQSAFSPDMLVIEQPIYIQNFKTSRDLSYIVGYTWGRFHAEGVDGIDIGPVQWKSAIGYKKVSAQEKNVWAETMTKTEVKKKADFERKHRVKVILEDIFPEVKALDDYDIIDAIGIGYWAAKYA